MTQPIPELEIIAKGKEMLVAFPVGTFPTRPRGKPKPRIGIGLDGKRPALFLIDPELPGAAGEVCIGHLPVDAIDFYVTCEQILCAEANPETGEVVDHGWARAVRLFEHHIHRAQ